MNSSHKQQLQSLLMEVEGLHGIAYFAKSIIAINDSYRKPGTVPSVQRDSDKLIESCCERIMNWRIQSDLMSACQERK